jgi:hypothetical protein
MHTERRDGLALRRFAVPIPEWQTSVVEAGFAARTASVHAFGVERRHDRRNFTFLPCYPPEW